MLQVLSRYCRLFISDKNAKDKYQKKIEVMSQSLDGISEFWIDSIKFEFQFNDKKAAANLMEKAFKSEMPEMIKFFDAALDFAEKFGQTEMEEAIQAAKSSYLKGKKTCLKRFKF